MVFWLIPRLIVIVFGTLYPAYYSFKAIRTKCVKEYVRWMMYWIVFAIYTVVEMIADLSISWFPFYYVIKMGVVLWLVLPYTKGAGVVFKTFLHPLLSSREREIDDYVVQAKEKSYETVVSFAKQSLSIATSVAVTVAVRGQDVISERLRSFSIPDLSQAPSSQSALMKASQQAGQSADTSSQGSGHKQAGQDEEADGRFSEDDSSLPKGLRRTQSVRINRTKVVRKELRYGSLKYKTRKRPMMTASTFDQP